MKLRMWTIIHKETYHSEWKQGICIHGIKTLNSDGSVVIDKYFSVEKNSEGNIKMIPFKYGDKFEILYCSDIDFSIGNDD